MARSHRTTVLCTYPGVSLPLTARIFVQTSLPGQIYCLHRFRVYTFGKMCVCVTKIITDSLLKLSWPGVRYDLGLFLTTTEHRTKFKCYSVLCADDAGRVQWTKRRLQCLSIVKLTCMSAETLSVK